MNRDDAGRTPLFFVVAVALLAGYGYHALPFLRAIPDGGLLQAGVIVHLFVAGGVLAAAVTLLKGEPVGTVFYLVFAAIIELGWVFSRQPWAGSALKIGGVLLALVVVGLVVRARTRGPAAATSATGTADDGAS